jgi:hypothetical protein
MIIMPVTGKEFHLGLTMSGAISAGAYTAGVLDFLIQALDEWEKVRDNGKTVPDHRVGLKVMAGASAGSITAAIGAIALVDGKQAPGVHRDQTGRAFHYYLPKLYDAWVVKPALQDEAAIGVDLLSLGDLDKPIDPNVPPGNFLGSTSANIQATGDSPPVASLLNVTVLAKIAEDALKVDEVLVPPKPYVAEKLHIYMTLTNLRGIPYKVPFKGGNYHMITHGDRMHYAVATAGGWQKPGSDSAFGEADASRPLDPQWLLASSQSRPKWRDFAVSALASSAFPVGLSPRITGGALNDYHERNFPSPELVDNHNSISPEWPASWATDAPFIFTTADGGIIDNDPFEYAHFAVKKEGKLKEPNEADPSKVERAVIMISPFPEAKPIRPAGEPTIDVPSLLSALFPSLINQARFKPDALALAAKEDHASRYLIGPSRTKRVDGKDVDERYGIASGLLGGFGGFVARAFRDHDYQLGRRNCQRFLQTSFALPATNPLVQQWRSAGINLSQFEAVNGNAAGPTYCLIPLLGSAKDEVTSPPWPRISQVQFDNLQSRIAARFDYVAPKLVAQNIKGLLGTLISLVLLPVVRDIPGLIRPRALDYARLTILADLVRRDQIEGWTLPDGLALSDDDARLVLAELLEPKFDQRNVKGISIAIAATPGSDPDEDKILAVLEALKSASGNCKVWEAPWQDKRGNRLFTLDSRKPNLFERVAGGSLKLALKPSVDPPGI